MKVYWLKGGEELSTADLDAQGVPHDWIDPVNYKSRLEVWKQNRNYAAGDEIQLSPETDDLDNLLKQFDKEHLHTDDEVRYVVSGAGFFDVRSEDDRWMRIEVTAGDFIVVPANVYHHFFLTAEKQIHAVSLFKENPSWVAVYR